MKKGPAGVPFFSSVSLAPLPPRSPGRAGYELGVWVARTRESA